MDDALFAELFASGSPSRYGCVLFDLQDVDGRKVAQPGAGWASVDGGKVARIKSPADLDTDVRWMSNLDRGTLWATRIKRMRDASYLRTDLGQIMKETGFQPIRGGMGTDAACQNISEMFSRTMGLANEHYGESEWQAAALGDDLRSMLLPEDDVLDEISETALSQAFVDFIETSNKRSREEMLVIARLPRLAHARNVLSTALPKGGWSVIRSVDFPDASRLDWLIAKQQPCLVKVALRGFLQKCPPWIPPILQTGQRLSASGQKADRDWMTLQEAQYFSRYVHVDIRAALLAPGWQDLSCARPLPDLGPLSDLSYSLGLLAECHWVSISGRHRDAATKKKTRVSSRACFERAADRFYCFMAANTLAASGFKILSYGLGAVSIACPPEKEAQLRELASSASLTLPPTSWEGE